MSAPRVVVRRGRVQPIACRHPWLFAGSIDRVEGDPAAGDVVDVVDPGGRFLGRGFYSPTSALRVRIFGHRPEVEPDRAFFAGRIEAAARFRRDALGLPAPETTDAYRLVHGEADGLPGLVVDALGPVLVLQIGHVAIERRKDLLLDALAEVVGDRPVLQRDDPTFRRREGLAPIAGYVRGDGPAAVRVRELGLTYEVDLVGGQKTGFYMDQRTNRALVAGLAGGRRVLDAFSYTGAFALNVARTGRAAEVVAVESSRAAVERARANADANRLGGIRFVQEDAYKFLGQVAPGDRFGLVVVDPPPYARKKGDRNRALQKYTELNRLALSALLPGGILVTCSCSGAVSEEDLEGVLRAAAVRDGTKVRIFARGGQAPDHPVDPACPEGRYLKALFCAVEGPGG